MKAFKLIPLILLAIFLAGCGSPQVMDGSDMVRSYAQISQEEAMRMMQEDDGHVIVDVRRQDEYDAGHIPGAILIPNEEIGTKRPEALPDLNQIILIYCRTGNRSKQAAQKLFNMGYTNIYEFGGINTWTGEIVAESVPQETSALEPAEASAQEPESESLQIWTAEAPPVSVRYDRMWEYSDYAETTDPETIAALVEAVQALVVGDPTDMATDDFTDILTFGFADGTTLRLEFEDHSWVTAGGKRYQVEGLSSLRGLLEGMLEDAYAAAIQPVPTLVIEANGRTFYAEPEDNSSAEAFLEALSSEPLEVELHDYGDFEKVGSLPWDLPRNDETITTVPGDVILYQGNEITIYYDENTWDFTRLAKIEGVTREDLLEVFGDGNVTVRFWVEWSE